MDLTLEREAEVSYDADAADRGIQLLVKLQQKMGTAWPDKGLVHHEDYEEVKAMLNAEKDEMMQSLVGDNEEGKKEFERMWPFDT